MWLTVPNLMSAGRIVLAPVLFLLIIRGGEGQFALLVALYLFTILLDFFDGLVARKLNQQSELGKILDPVADKLLMVLLIIAFLIKARFPIWVAVSVLIRDLAILSVSALLYRRAHAVKPSIFVGKATFTLLSILVYLYVIDLHPGIDLVMLKRYFSVLTFAFILWSFYEYYKVFKSLRPTS